MSKRSNPLVYGGMKMKRPLSWSEGFARRAHNRRLVLKYGASSPHLLHNWSRAMRPHLPIALPKLAGHAPWLNGEAIAYRQGLGRPTVDGYFIS